MKKIIGVGGLLLVSILSMLLPLAAGQGEVTVYTIPGSISVNSSFLWVAEVPPGLENVRVSWVIIGLVESGALGAFEKLADTKWFCNFGIECGPNPFPMAGGPYDANIYVTSDSGVITESHAITVSDLKVDPHLYPSGNDVLVQVYVTEFVSLAYSLYDADTLEIVQIGGEPAEDRNLAYCNCPAGFYNTSLSLENGKYYMSFEATTTDDRSGGSLEYFTIGEELSPVSVSLDKDEYLLGERVLISGTTTFTSATGEIKRNGASVRNMTFSLFSRGEYREFSYDYLPGETGNYELYVFAGYGNDSASQTLSFSVSRLLDITIPDIYVNESGTLEKNFTVKNLANQTLNITVSPDDELKSYVTAGLDEGSLGPGESATLTLSIRNILGSKEGKIVFHTNLVDIEKTVRIKVEGVVEENPRIGVSPLVWSEEEGYLLGEVSKTFTIENKGTGTLKGFDYSVEGIETDIVIVTFPESVGMVPDSGDMGVSVDPVYSGRYRRVLSVTSNGGSQDILIDLQFFDDISTGIDDLEWEIQSVVSELTGRGIEVPYAVTELASDLAQAETDLGNGYYASANRNFENIQGKWDGVKSIVILLPAAGGDLSLVLIVVVVLVVAVAAFFLFRKLRGRGAGKKKEGYEETEEDLEEEFY